MGYGSRYQKRLTAHGFMLHPIEKCYTMYAYVVSSTPLACDDIEI